MADHLVFVYGTLRMHEVNAGILEGAELVAAQARIEGRIVDTGNGYPSAVLDTTGTVYGEIYGVSDEQLMNIDQLEGYIGPAGENWYDRVRVLAETDVGPIDVWTYTFTTSQAEGMKTIELGDWRARNLLDQQELYFYAYGSAMDNARMKLAGVDHLFTDIVGCGHLNGYSLRFTYISDDGLGRADLVEMGGNAQGVVYHIGPDALKYLYQREGVYKEHYYPALVDVRLHNSVIPNVVVFLVVHKKSEVAPPDHYLEEIIRGGTGILDESYLREVEKHVENLRMKKNS